jgi:predicted ArsR family transcriptional regulator
MDNHIPPTGASTTTGEILAVLAAEEPHGATADHVARALGLGLTGEAVEVELEELMGRGLLDRRGLGHGTVYTLSAAGRAWLR